MIKTETLWREPDTLGNIYPWQTIATETTAKRHTDKNIVTIRADTIYISDDTDHTSSVETRHVTSLHSPPSEGHPFLRWLPWVLMLLLLVVIIVSRRIR